MEKYDKWSRYEPEEKGVMIAYASMYGNTEVAAFSIHIVWERIFNIVGEWNGVVFYIDGELTPMDEGLITAIINDDNTCEFRINGKVAPGVWVQMDSSGLEEGEFSYGFVSDSGEELGKGIISDKSILLGKNTTAALTFFW